MRVNATGRLFVLAIVAIWPVVSVFSQAGRPEDPSTAHLRWKNQDVLEGTLEAAESGRITWSSPIFLDHPVIETSALDMVVLSREYISPEERYLVVTKSGDVFSADLENEDEDHFSFNSKTLGNLRIFRGELVQLSLRGQSNLLGSESLEMHRDRARQAAGPVRNLTFTMYDGVNRWPRWTNPFPEVAWIEPASRGSLPAGWIDLSLAGPYDQFVMIFNGEVITTLEGEYIFSLSAKDGAKLFVDGRLIGIAYAGEDCTATAHLGLGTHPIKVEFGKYTEGGEAALKLNWTGPGFRDRSLVGTNPYPVSTPDSGLPLRPHSVVMEFVDGAILHGTIEECDGEWMVFLPGFSDNPLRFSLLDVATIRFPMDDSGGVEDWGNVSDLLYYSTGYLHGRLSFGFVDGFPLGWRLAGAEKPVQFCGIQGARVERGDASLTDGQFFETEDYPFVLCLKNGEVFPCGQISGAGAAMEFGSPFGEKLELAPEHLKAMEFTSLAISYPAERIIIRGDDWSRKIQHSRSLKVLGVDPVTLDRALSIPGLAGENAASHLLIVKTGDLKRGRLLGIGTDGVQFASLDRELMIPIDRLACLVDIRETDDAMSKGAGYGMVRAFLTDGSILVFEPLELEDGILVGQSPLYGRVAVPLERIQHLVITEFGNEDYRVPYEKWVVKGE